MLTLIKAERLLYGKFRYRLEVERRIWILSIRSVYRLAAGPEADWYDPNNARVGGFLADDLNALLTRALACNQVPPQAISPLRVPA